MGKNANSYTVHLTVSLINVSTYNYAVDKRYQRGKTLADWIWTRKPIESDRLAVTPSNKRINPERAFPRRLKKRKWDIPKQIFPVLPQHLINVNAVFPPVEVSASLD